MNNSSKELRRLAFGEPARNMPSAVKAGSRGNARAGAPKGARVDGARPRRSLSKSLFLIISLVVAPGALIGARASIVDAWSPAASMYRAVGLPVNLRGLEIVGVRSRIHDEGGRSLLVVEGEIANVSGRRLPVPQIRLSLRSEHQREVYAWSEASPRSELDAAERIFFRTRLASPPQESREVLVRFLPPQPTASMQVSYRNSADR